MATPANVTFQYEIQDNRGFRSNMSINMFEPDIDASVTVLGDIATGVEAVGTVVQALTNAKVVKSGFTMSFDYAQEPSSETGVYELVIQKARLQGGDGAGGFMSLSVPAPKDGLFLTSADNNLIVVNPAATLLTNFQSALTNSGTGIFGTPRGGSAFAQFFGGQLVEGKPRRRRVLQGA
jgi:hypothetical protein